MLSPLFFQLWGCVVCLFFRCWKCQCFRRARQSRWELGNFQTISNVVECEERQWARWREEETIRRPKIVQDYFFPNIIWKHFGFNRIWWSICSNSHQLFGSSWEFSEWISHSFTWLNVDIIIEKLCKPITDVNERWAIIHHTVKSRDDVYDEMTGGEKEMKFEEKCHCWWWLLKW